MGIAVARCHARWIRTARRRMIDGPGGRASSRFLPKGSPMVRCLHCGWTSHSDQGCPRCGGRLTTVAPPRPPRSDCTEKPGDWLMVARFGNAAEAGYLADDLHHRLGCEPRIEVNDDFDAVHACWHTRYSLLVPAVQA